MAEKKITIRWTASAQRQFHDIITYLRNESAAGAEVVFEAIIFNINQLALHPQKYPPDPLRADKDKSFRAFTVFSYRITYRISVHTIYIYRIRHSSREPLIY